MSHKSTGKIPPAQPIRDANQAVALLATMHHWAATKVNSDESGVRYSVTVTHGGRRASGSERTFVAAVMRAMENLREPRPRKHAGSWVPPLKLVRYEP